MNQIDFLPRRYHDRKVQRRVHTLRGLVVGCYLLLLVMAAAHRRGRQHALEAELEAARICHQAVAARQEQRQQLQTQVRRLDAQAELFAYLRQRWSCTRLLSHVLAAVPQGVVLRELQIQHEMPAGRAARPLLTPEQAAPADQAEEQPPPAEDLRRLRQQWDTRRCQVLLSGMTEDLTRLHEFLGHLGSIPIVRSAELLSIESVRNSDLSQFQARAMLLWPIAAPGSQPPDPDTPGQSPSSRLSARLNPALRAAP